MTRISFCSVLFACLLATTVSFGAPPCYDQWESFDVSDGLPSDKVLCVLATDDGVWAGTDHGLALYRGGEWSVFTVEDGLAHPGVLCLAEDADSGEIWIGTMGGVSRYSGGRFDSYRQINSGLANDVVYGVTVHRGEVWAATAAGTSRFQIGEDKWSIYDESNAPMHEIWCYSVAGNGDRMYVAVWGGGLLEWQYDKERWQRYQDPDKEMEIDLFVDDGLVHDVVTGVTVDDLDRVWVGTYFGLSSYDGRKWVSALDHDTPLLSNFINFVQAEGEYCWFATDQGLSAWDRETWWNYSLDPEGGSPTATWYSADGKEETIELESLFPHNYLLGLSFHDGELWVATEGGVARGRISSDRASIDPREDETGDSRTSANGERTARGMR